MNRYLAQCPLSGIPSASLNDWVGSFTSLNRNNFHRISDEVVDEIDGRGKLSLDNIDLPSVEALRSYLRQRTSSDEQSGSVWDPLLEEFGVTEAARRTAGLPIDTPAAFLEAYGSASYDDVETAPDGDAISPLRALLRAQALVAADRDEAAIAAAIHELTDTIANRGRLFVALVRYGTALALGREDWSALEPPVRLQLLWVYANRFVEVLSPPGTEMHPIAEWIAERTRFDLADQSNLLRQPEWYELLTHGLSSERLEALIAARVLGFLPEGAARENLSEWASERIGHRSERGWSPTLIVASPCPEAPAGWWAARDPIPTFVEAGWLASTHAFAERTDDAMAGHLVSDAADQTDARVIPIVLSTIDASKVEPATAERMRDLLDRVEAEAMLEPEVAGSFCVMAARARVSAALGDVDDFRRRLEKQARRAAAKWLDERLVVPLRETPASAAFESLVDNAHRHARLSAGEEGNGLEVFALHVAALVRGWPNCRQAAIRTLDAFVRGSPCEAARDAWPVLLAIRSEDC